MTTVTMTTTMTASHDSTAILAAPQVESQASSVARRVYTATSRDSALDLRESFAYEADVLVQLKANMAQLEDLHGRLRYMMSELSYLLKK